MGNFGAARRRKELFAKWDVNSNGSLGFNEVDTSMRELMDGVMGALLRSKQHSWSFSWKPVLMRAFAHAKGANSEWRGAKRRQDDFVELDEFKLLLECADCH